MDYNGGKVFFSRKIREHWLWRDATKFQWWVDLVMGANYKDTKSIARGKLFVLKRGQLEASTEFLAKRWGASRPTIIGFLRLLEEDDMIKRETLYGSKSIITICKYDSYQTQVDTSLDTSLDTKRINKEINNILNSSLRSEFLSEDGPKPKRTKEQTRQETIKRRDKFYQDLVPFVEKYGKELIRNFFDYWSEMNKSCSKMRFEQERTWEIERRLQTWERNDRKKIRNNENKSSQYGNYSIGCTYYGKSDEEYKQDIKENGWT